MRRDLLARLAAAHLAALTGLAAAVTGVPGTGTAHAQITSAAYSTSLSGGQRLWSGQQIKSPNGRYRLVMQRNGNLVEYGPHAALWATGTSGSSNDATMQRNGDLVVFSRLGKPLWQSGTAGPRTNVVLRLQDDSNLVIYRSSRAMWARSSSLTAGGPGQRLSAGQQIASPNGQYRLVMQTDGNLVQYGPSGAVWATGTSGSGNWAVMQTDGNLVVYTAGGTALWQSGTGGHLNAGGFVLDLQNDSNLVIYGVGNLGELWSREGTPLTFGTWPGTGGPAAANLYYGYPYRDPPACTDGGACLIDKWDFYQGQCTSWVAYRLNQLNGFAFSDYYGGQGAWGNASNWGPHARALGIAVNGTPTVGSVAWYSSGHVAYVERVNSATSIVISEMNFDFDNGFRVWTITASGGYWPTDFIHIHDR